MHSASFYCYYCPVADTNSCTVMTVAIINAADGPRANAVEENLEKSD